MKKPNHMWKIYLDMDGVLSDFDKRFVETFNIKPNDVRGTFTASDQWKQFVEQEHFATLDWFPGGKELLAFLRQFDIPIEILSSSGGHIFHEEITKQKTAWLRDNNINFPVNVVPGKKYKKDYADWNHLLIDDTERNIIEFLEAGGMAILHNNPKNTIATLEFILT